MNIVYKEFSDIGEYFKAVQSKDFASTPSLGEVNAALLGAMVDKSKQNWEKFKTNLEPGKEALKEFKDDVVEGVQLPYTLAKESAGNLKDDYITGAQYMTNRLRGQDPLTAAANTTRGQAAKEVGERLAENSNSPLPYNPAVGATSLNVSTPEINVKPNALNMDGMHNAVARQARWEAQQRQGEEFIKNRNAELEASHGVKYDPSQWAKHNQDLYDKASVPTRGVPYSPEKVAERHQQLYKDAEAAKQEVNLENQLNVWKSVEDKVKSDVATVPTQDQMNVWKAMDEKLAPKTPGLLDRLKDSASDIAERIKDTSTSIMDVNNNGTVDPAEWAGAGALGGLALTAGALAIRRHKKNKQIRKAVSDYARRYPNSKLAKAAGFSEKEEREVR